MHLYFVRHGESEANAQQLVAGQTIDSPLTALGEQEAHSAAQWIKDNNLTFDLIISSPMLRTKRTATIIAHAIGYPVKDIAVDRNLIERFCGNYEGGPVDAYHEAPESVAVKEMGVESLEDLYNRVCKVLEKLQTEYAKKTVLVVSHNGTGKMLRIAIEGRDATEMDKVVSLPNANVSKLL